MYRPDGIVVTGDDEIDTIGIAVGIHHADNGDLQIIRFRDRDAFVIDIDYEEGIGQPPHILNTTNAALKLRLGTGQH